MKWINENWITPDTFGFIYIITNITNGRIYIGSKYCYHTRKVKIGKREKAKSKTRKTFKYVVKETDWRTYTGSSKELNDDIAKGDLIEKRILKLVNNKKQIKYYETKYQFIYNVLENDSYNANILGKYFYKDLL